MDYRPAEMIMIEDKELELLLAAAGISKWYGIRSGSGGVDYEDDGAVNEILAHLYQKGLIDWHEGKAKISDMIRPAVRVMKEAAYCITVKRTDRQEDLICCYFGSEKAVCIGRDRTSANELELYVTDAGLWPEMLKSDSYLPEVADYPDMSDPMKRVRSAEGYKGELITLLERYNITDGKLTGSILLYDDGMYGHYEMKSGSGELLEKSDYRQKDIFRILLRWAGVEL